MPEVARLEGLKMASIGHVAWGGWTYSCCSTAAYRFYTEWLISKQCRHTALLHPIKVRGLSAEPCGSGGGGGWRSCGVLHACLCTLWVRPGLSQSVVALILQSSYVC